MASLTTRRLGRSEITVSAMGLGCWAIGGPFFRDGEARGWGDVDDDVSIRAIHRALDLGVNFFDTADVYGAGHSEAVVGRALKGRRGEVVIATKFGNRFDPETKEASGQAFSREYIREACHASLRRLQTDYIDIYQLHLGLSIPEAERVLDALDDLVADGLIRAYAWSTDDPERAAVFASRPHCTSVQHRLNVFEDAPEMLALCEQRDLASINRSPLAMGLLTGKFDASTRISSDDIRGTDPGWLRYFHDGRPSQDFLDKLDAVREILTSEGRTLAQGAIAWIWGRSGRTIPIPGFRNAEQVEENAGAMRHGPLTADQMREIDKLLDR